MPSVSSVQTSVGDRYRVLLEIGRKLTGTLAIEELYRAIYDETAGVIEVSGFYISLYDPDSDMARVVFYADKGEVSRCDITYRGSDSEVIRAGKATRVQDRLDEEFVMLLGDEASEVTRSAISSPLLLQERVIGAISAQSYRPGAYTEDDIELLDGIADLSAIAVANARRVNELDRQRHEAEKIEEIGRALTSSLDFEDVLLKVSLAALDLLEGDGAGVWMIDGTLATCRQSVGSIQIPIGAEWDIAGPIFDALVTNVTPFEIEDLSVSALVPEALRDVLEGGSGLALPLVVGGEVVGALASGWTEVKGFSEYDRRALTRLAGQATVALDNASLHESVQALSLTDPLTGLPNRRHLEMHLYREVAAARRGRPLCLVIFDLDNFKQYNDTLGHMVGDVILRTFADVLEAENREMNLVARFGGDEFVSVLSESDEAGAEGYLRRVRGRVREDEVLAQHEVTVSCGIALFDQAKMSGVEDLFEVADRHMYAQKEKSR
jgi:diguanylate cyclase (GGDEF)-like protein